MTTASFTTSGTAIITTHSDHITIFIFTATITTTAASTTTVTITFTTTTFTFYCSCDNILSSFSSRLFAHDKLKMKLFYLQRIVLNISNAVFDMILFDGLVGLPNVFLIGFYYQKPKSCYLCSVFT